LSQIKRCVEARALLDERGLHPSLVHMSNSAAVIARPETWKTMVRPGILLYGYSLPTMRGGETTAESCLPLRPVLTWKTRVLTVNDVPAGQAVGQMGRYVSK